MHRRELATGHWGRIIVKVSLPFALRSTRQLGCTRELGLIKIGYEAFSFELTA